MWRSLGLALLAGLLVGCRAESEPDGARCKPAAVWKIGDVEPLTDSLGRVSVVAFLQASCLFCLSQAARLDELRQKLEDAAFVNITYMVVNSQDEISRRLHPLLEKKLSDSIPLYKQNPEDPDVWRIAKAEKDDFQIYDRCGRLTHHLSLPYTILSQPHVEEAIRKAYCSAACGDCELEQSDHLKACNRTEEEKTEEAAPRTEEDHHHHHHHHPHGHHRGHHHGGHHHGGHHHGHHPLDGEERQSHGGSNHQHGQEGQVNVGQVQTGSLGPGQVQRRQFDLGQAHVGQIDLGQIGIGQLDLEHVADDVGNQQVMRRP